LGLPYVNNKVVQSNFGILLA